MISEIDALYGSDEEPELSEAPAAATEGAAQSASTASAAPAAASIVGSWDCFDPVTGRTSKYGFAAGGNLTIRLPGGELQAYTYETSGQRVNIVDSTPPRTLGIEELGARRVVLSSGAGQRLVCSR